jgi:hypothetical protein
MATTHQAVESCPRCSGYIDHTYPSEPPGCIQCGYEDYTYEAPKVKLRRDRWLSGSVVKLRYVGFAPSLEAVMMEVKTKAPEIVGGNEVVTPTCPLTCGLPMKYSPTSGGAPRRDLRYRCASRHRVFITVSDDGQWRGWM